MNQATLIGNVGRDPEIRTTHSGEKIANITLATTDRWKDKNTGEKREATEWHRISIFGPLAGVVERYVTKGSKLMIQGQIKTRKWQDQSGVEKYSTEIILSGPRATMTMLDAKQGGDDPKGPAASTADYGDLDDDIPF